VLEPDALTVVRDDGALLESGLDGGKGQTRIVHQAVLIHETASEAAGIEERLEAQHLASRELLERSEGVSARERFVAEHAHPELELLSAPTVRRKEVEGGPHQVRRQPKEDGALVKRFPHQADLEMLQVAEPAVNHLRRLAAAAGSEVALFDERDRQSPESGIPGDAGPGRAASQNGDVEVILTEPLEVSGARAKREVAPLNFELGPKHDLIPPSLDVWRRGESARL
jgi:hypothetical protein